MMFNYYYDRTPIPMERFLQAVPNDWIDYVVDGTYSYGYYRAILIEEI